MPTFWFFVCNRKYVVVCKFSHETYHLSSSCIRSYSLSLSLSLLSFFSFLASSHIWPHVYVYFFHLYISISRRLVIFYWDNRKVVQGDVVQAFDRRNTDKRKTNESNLSIFQQQSLTFISMRNFTTSHSSQIDFSLVIQLLISVALVSVCTDNTVTDQEVHFFS